MKKIMVVAGEISSDNYGRKLINELKKTNPRYKIYAVGGKKMQEAADLCVANIVQRAVVGFTEALREIPFLLRLKRKIRKKYFSSSSPHRVDGIVLIDYPGFNIRLAKAAYKCNIPVYYYITPQVWAWGRRRIKVLSKICRKLFCVFPFEKELFTAAGGDAEFVGHPILDEIPPPGVVEDFSREMNISSKEKIIALLPGSRKREVETVLPPVSEALKKFNARVIVGLAPSVSKKDIRRFMDYGEITSSTAALLLRADAAVVASGTSNLEAALSLTPFISVYKISPISYFLAKMLVRVRYISIVNILASRKVVEELLQSDLTVQNIRKNIKLLLTDKRERQKVTKGLREVAGRLGSPGAADRVASMINESLLR